MARSINDVLKTQGESLGADDAKSVQRLKTWLLHPGAHFLLLFDGLNEVEGKYHLEARNALRSLLNYPQSVVVSCREHDYDGSLQELTTAYCLESLPDDAIRTFLGWFLEGKAPNIMWESGEALFRELESDERLLSLARNPLLLRLIGEVAWESPQTDLPANRARLFERFVKVMPQRRRQEGMDLGVPDYKVKVALRQLGLAMHEHDQLKADLEDVHRWLPQADDAFDLALRQAQEWRFLESDGGRGVEVEFIHPLFIEFFAADAMFERLNQGESLDSVVGQHTNDSRWHEVLLLLGGLMNEPQTLILWLTNEAQRTTNTQTALLANQLLLLMMLENAQKPSNSTSKSKPNATDEVDKGALDDAVLQAMLSVLNNPDNLEAFHTASIHENEYERWQQQQNDITAIEQEIESHLNAGPQVVAMFMSGNERLVASADRILRRMKHPAVELLLDVLENPRTDVDTRCRTIEVLAEIGDWRVSLREAAEVEKRPADGSKEDNRNGWQTVRVRCGTADQLRQEDIEKERQILLEMERCDKPHGLWQRRMTLLLQALHDSDPLIRVAAVQALAKDRKHHFHKDDHPVDAILEATTDREAEVRRYAVDALGWWMWDSWWCEWWDEATVLATFTHALNDTDENVRQAAIHGMGRMDSEETAHQLIELLNHFDANMRLSSIHALQERHELSSVPALERLLSDEAEVTRVNIGTLYHAQKVSTEAADAIRSIQRHHQNNQ